MYVSMMVAVTIIIITIIIITLLLTLMVTEYDNTKTLRSHGSVRLQAMQSTLSNFAATYA